MFRLARRKHEPTVRRQQGYHARENPLDAEGVKILQRVRHEDGVQTARQEGRRRVEEVVLKKGRVRQQKVLRLPKAAALLLVEEAEQVVNIESVLYIEVVVTSDARLLDGTRAEVACIDDESSPRLFERRVFLQTFVPSDSERKRLLPCRACCAPYRNRFLCVAGEQGIGDAGKSLLVAEKGGVFFREGFEQQVATCRIETLALGGSEHFLHGQGGTVVHACKPCASGAQPRDQHGIVQRRKRQPRALFQNIG